MNPAAESLLIGFALGALLALVLRSMWLDYRERRRRAQEYGLLRRRPVIRRF